MPTMPRMAKTTRKLTQPAIMVTIRIPANTRQQLKIAAAGRGMTIGNLVTSLTMQLVAAKSSPSAQGSR